MCDCACTTPTPLVCGTRRCRNMHVARHRLLASTLSLDLASQSCPHVLQHPGTSAPTSRNGCGGATTMTASCPAKNSTLRPSRVTRHGARGMAHGRSDLAGDSCGTTHATANHVARSNLRPRGSTHELVAEGERRHHPVLHPSRWRATDIDGGGGGGWTGVRIHASSCSGVDSGTLTHRISGWLAHCCHRLKLHLSFTSLEPGPPSHCRRMEITPALRSCRVTAVYS